MLTSLRSRLAAAPAGASSSIPLDASRSRTRSLPRPRPELLGLLVLAAVLNLWGLSQNGWANEYYSAAVRSMTSSWHNFIFGAFDPAGVMTVDKPPLALWVQAASAKLFGFSSLSMLVPQALMGVAAVALVYDLTRRVFGRPAGFVAGLVLALTPITVAISRHNNPDALLVLLCVAALWCVVRGLADGRTRWLVLAGVAIGLGFETKMAAALIVVPGLAAAWLWAAPGGGFARVRQLLAGGAAMVAVGAAWPLLIALTAVGNTAANRRLTFGVRGRAGLLRQHALGAVVFFLTLGLTSGALAVLHGIDATPARAVELATLIAASTAATVTRYLGLKTWVFAGYRRSAIKAAARAAPSASTGR
jgi:4-amino-4-deoxy-L-arabinose transferase-like glycosyltransferase